MERDPQTGAVIGAAIEVHKALGHGFLEAVYQFALARELDERDIPYRAQAPIPVFYKGERLGCGYRADFICYGDLLVEIKAQSGLTEYDEAQVINYLRATDLERALLLNFGATKLAIKRFILTPEHRTGEPQWRHKKPVAGEEAGLGDADTVSAQVDCTDTCEIV